MSRTISHTGYDDRTGVQPQWVLEIDIDPITSSSSSEEIIRFSSEDDVPVAGAVGRVMNWGELTLAARPGQSQSNNTITITLADPDRYFHGLQETQPGLQGLKAWVKLYFGGADPVTIFGGTITSPLKWSESNAQWTMTLKDFGHLFDRNIGRLMRVDDFPEIDCGQCENRIMPIVYGTPCYRVPACVIDRPGRGQLASTLLIHHSTLTLNTTAARAGFTSGEEITIVVGTAGFWEKLTGSFATSDTNVFDITDRGAILASGDVNQFGAEGQQYISIPKDDLPDDGATSRGGYPLHLKDGDDNWFTLAVTYWSFEGSSIVVTEQGQLDVNFGDDYILGSVPGWTPVWQPGTPVYEIGNWTYAVNHLPSQSVDRVEGVMNINSAGRQRNIMATVNSSYYSVNLNNQDYNAALGRGGSDPGITTVTLNFSPVQIGSDTENVYVTLKGTTTDLTGGGTAMTNPADVIEHILTDDRIGGIDASMINSSSFTAAKSSISTVCSFALMNEKLKLSEVVTQLANQANCVLFWDQGQAVLKYLEETPNAGDSVLTIDNDNRKAGSLEIEEKDAKEYITEMIGKFRPAVPSEELLLMRTSTDAIDDYQENREEIDFWAYQYPSSVALATENWLNYWLHRNRKVTITTFLNAVHVQPGDIVDLDARDGNDTVIVDGAAQVLEVRHTPGNVAQRRIEEIKIVCEQKLWDYTIEVDAPTDDNCVGDWLTRHYGSAAKYFLRSTGKSRSLFVGPIPTHGPEFSGNIDTPIEPEQSPNADVVVPVAVIANWQPKNFVPPAGAHSFDSTGDSSDDDCIDELDGIDLSEITQENSPDYVLSLVDGCLRLTPVTACPVDSSSA